MSELENRLRPGAYSVKGFLGLAESLEVVLNQDELALQKANVSYEQISAELEKIVSAALEQKYKVLHTNYQEFREREYHSVNWFKQLSPIFSIENLPGPNIGYVIDNKYQVLFVQYRGFQDCPWNCEKADWGSFDFLLLNLKTGEYITAPGLIVHLIREHCFFEGKESPYRVEPSKLIQVLELIS